MAIVAECYAAGFENGERSHEPKNAEHSALEAGKDEREDSLSSLQTEPSPADTLSWAH